MASSFDIVRDFSITDVPSRPMKVDEDMTFGNLSLEDELMSQYRRAKRLSIDSENEDVPPNQKAQTLNTVTSILQLLVKLLQK